MKNCKYCRTEIDKKAKICPNCRKPQGSSILRIFLGVVIALIIIFAIITLDVEQGLSDNFSYEITEEGYEYSNIGYHIDGIVTNNTNKNYSYVQIEFVCYDTDGNNLGTAMDNVNNLSGKEKWKFSAVSLFVEENVDHCVYKDITGW